MEINRLFAAVAALFVIFIFIGWHKGFLRIVISFAGTIVIIIATAIMSPKLSRYVVENTGIYERTQEKVTEVFLEKLVLSDEEKTEDRAGSEDEGSGSSYLKDLDLPDILKNDLIEKTASEMYQALVAVVIKDYVSVYLARIIVNAGSFVAMYAALSFALWVVVKSSDIISKIPVIKGFNKMLGALTGVAQALIIVWVFFFVVIMFMGNETGSRLLRDVQASSFLRYLFNNNFLFRFIS